MSSLQIGDYYEDCGYHPRQLVEINGDDLEGRSLVDDTIGQCSEKHCGVVKLTKGQAENVVFYGPNQNAKDWYRKNAPHRIWWD
jgi:hypothetical protein